MASWTDLPLDLLDLVVAGLPDPADRARCRAVCRTWHSAVRRRGPQAQQLPWIVLCNGGVITPPDECVEYFDSIPDNAICKSAINDWLLLGMYDQSPEEGQYCFDNYVLHNPFSLEDVPLPELDAALSRGYNIRKILMRSTVHDFIVFITTNVNTPIIVILPGKGVWMPEPQAAPYIYIVDIAFLGDKLYALTKAEDLFPFDLGLDEDGSPRVTIGRRIIRRPLDYEGYELWPASDDDNGDLDDDDVEEEEVGEDEVGVDVVVYDEEEEEEAEVALDVLDEDSAAYWNNVNFLSCSDDNISDDEIIIWHLVESHGKLLMVKPPMHTPGKFSTPSIRQVEVFQADVDTGKWVLLANSLGDDQALFIGRCFSKSVSAPCGDVAEGDIYFIESGEVVNIKTQFSNVESFCKPIKQGIYGMWLFPTELVL